MTPGARDLLAGAGVALAALGVVFVADPRLAGLGVGEAAVLVVGVLALLHGLWVVRERWDHEVEQAVTATPERPLSAPTPGTEFDRTLGYRVTVEESRPYRQRVAGRVREVADAVAEQYGTLGDEVLSDRPSLTADPLGSVRNVLGGESSFQANIRESVDRLAVRAGVADTPLASVASQPLPEDPALDREEPVPAVEAGDRGEGLRRHAVRETTRWRGVKAVALLSIGVGIVSKQPAVLLGGVAGFGYAGYAQSGSSGPVELAVERHLADDEPRPGEAVEVTLEVENVGDRTLADLRLVDGVPSALPVTEGSPRRGVALRPGTAVRFSYTVTARRGEHEFDPLTVIARDVTGAVEEEFTLHEPTTMVCLPEMYPAAAAPLRAQGSGFAGQVRADVGGAGTEFHATREYRHGDPLNRIDWNRKARTGELATMEFREERVATVLVVVDAREGAWRSPPDATATSLDRSVYAAGRLFAALLAGGNQVGLAAAGARETWLRTGAGDEHRARARQLLARDPAFAARPADREFYSLPWLRRLRRQLEGDAQVVVVTPLADDLASILPRWIEGYGFPVTVVSPDPTGDLTTGQRLARVERALRLTDLRARGINAVDWAWDEPLDVALLRADERWRG